MVRQFSRLERTGVSLRALGEAESLRKDARNHYQNGEIL